MKKLSAVISVLLVMTTWTFAFANSTHGDKNHTNDHSKTTTASTSGGSTENNFSPSNSFSPNNSVSLSNSNTFNPVNQFSPTVVGGPSYGDNSGNTFSGITGGSFNPLGGGAAPAGSGTISKTAVAAGQPAATDVRGAGIAGVGQANSYGGQMNNGVGVQDNRFVSGTYVENNGVGAGSTNINQKYEEARQMAVVISSAVTSALRFKEGAHSDTTDSRVMKVSDLLKYVDSIGYEEAKRGKGKNSDVKIIDGLIRPQFHKTKEINLHQSKSKIKADNHRFIGFITGVAGTNDTTMENVVFGVGEFAMDNGATDLVLVKESATEWGDTTGYAFDLGSFVTSIIGGAGSRAIGPGGSAAAGINGMNGGSADRSDCKFAAFVSNDKLKEVSAVYEKK